MSQGNSKFAGLTDEQVKIVLEQIASAIDLACSICRNESAQSDGVDQRHVFDSLALMLSGVGALADMASGEGVIGDLPAWLCGPLFQRAGMAVRP